MRVRVHGHPAGDKLAVDPDHAVEGQVHPVAGLVLGADVELPVGEAQVHLVVGGAPARDYLQIVGPREPRADVQDALLGQAHLL